MLLFPYEKFNVIYKRIHCEELPVLNILFANNLAELSHPFSYVIFVIFIWLKYITSYDETVE